MSFRYFPDGNGDTMKVYDDDGRLTPLPSPTWHTMTQLRSRDDDVLICSYPKSGTHWIWEIVRMLMKGKLELSTEEMWNSLLLYADPTELDKMESPRVLCTHRRFHDLPSDFILHKRKLVVLLREPKDVCVSWYKFLSPRVDMKYQGTFDGFITLFLQGKVPWNSWSNWVLSYEKGLKEHPDQPHHAVYYEQLKQDPVSEIRRLAEYLGVSPSLADAVAEKTQFSNMKTAKSQVGTSYRHLFKDNEFSQHVYRKGESGGWKQRFSEQQAADFDAYISQQLHRSSTKPCL